MRDLRIVFMGTPDFAVNVLKEILKAGYKIEAVITAPDRPAGRGRKLQESAVKQFAVSQGLKVLQPPNLKDPGFVEELKALRPNVQVVVAFRMLPEIVWDLPEYGTFNLHASLLPQYRGAAPINWAIMNGETVSGVSTFFIDKKIDTGKMILQKQVNVSPEETAGELHDKLMRTGAELVVETLDLIKNDRVITREQKEDALLKDAPKLTKDNTKIDWTAPAGQIFNFIRGLNPYPAAWCYLENGKQELQMKIFEVELLRETHDFHVGRLLEVGNELKVAVEQGYIVLKELQLPGKRKMKVNELLNGYHFETDAKVR